MATTALVTGASSGIGKALSRVLAENGHSLVLVARSEPKLEALAQELRAAHGTRVEVACADLALRSAPHQLFEQVCDLGLDVDVLVNNAGFGSSGAFLDLDLEGEVDMLEVNAVSLLQLCHRFGRGMRERGSGRILNVASTAGFLPGPYMATYYATKAFVVAFSLALAHELRGSGVSVTCHCPGPTLTGFSERSGTAEARLFRRPDVATAETVARHAYRAMKDGKRLTVPGALNALGVASTRLAPRGWLAGIAAGLNRTAPATARSASAKPD